MIVGEVSFIESLVNVFSVSICRQPVDEERRSE